MFPRGPIKLNFQTVHFRLLSVALPFDIVGIGSGDLMDGAKHIGNNTTQWAVVALSWQSGHFQQQSSAVRIQSLGNLYIEHLLTVNCIVLKRRKYKEKRGREWPILKQYHSSKPNKGNGPPRLSICHQRAVHKR